MSKQEKCNHNYQVYNSKKEEVKTDFYGMTGFIKKLVYYMYCTHCLDEVRFIPAESKS